MSDIRTNEDIQFQITGITDGLEGDDLLGFDPYVEAITAFLSYKDTDAPLTMSIEGEWGAGKSFFMRQLKKKLEEKGSIVIEFNAWRHDKEEALWAAFALEFINQISYKVSLSKWFKGFFQLRYSRLFSDFDWKHAGRSITKILFYAFIFFLFAICVYQSIRGVQHGIDQWKNYSGFSAFIINNIFLIIWIISSIILYPCVDSFASTLNQRFIKHLKIDLKNLIKIPHYEDRVAFIERFHTDFKKIVKSYADDRKIFVIIDDLDRCEVPKAAELMQAINLMISEQLPLIFILGLDREKVAAGIALKNKDLLPFLSRSYQIIKLDGVEYLRGVEFGYQFLEKFIQIPFTLPIPQESEIQQYVNHLTRVKTNLKGELPKKMPRKPETIDKKRGESVDLPIEKSVIKKEDPDISIQVSEYHNDFSSQEINEMPEFNTNKDQSLRILGEESERIKTVIVKLATFLDNNPRRIKQFINLFRLQLCIACTTGLLVDRGMPFNIEQIGKLVVLSLRWPLFLLDWKKSQGLIKSLETKDSKSIDSTLYNRWSSDKILLSFLDLRINNNYDCSLDLLGSMLFDIYPPIYTLLPTEPGDVKLQTPPNTKESELIPEIELSLLSDCVLSKNGRLALSASRDNTLTLWDITTAKELHTLIGHSDSVLGCALSEDGSLALSASEDKTLKLWDTATGKEIRTFAGHSSSVLGCCFSGDGQLVLSASEEETLKLWDMATGKELQTFTGHKDSVNGCALSGDGQLALSASYDQTLKLWDTSTGKEIRTFTGHSNVIWDCALSSDGRLALSASDDHTLKLWDTATGKVLHTLEHSNSVLDCSLSEDGRLALSASEDQTLKLWDTTIGKELHTLIGHSDSVFGCSLSGDGQLILSASDDHTLKLWETTTGKILFSWGKESNIAK